MTDRISRRQLLAAVPAGSAAVAAGCSTFGGGDTERAELLERVRELRADVDECNSDREMLRALELEARSLDDEPFFDADVAASVRETVLPLRQSVVKMRVDHPHYEGEQSGATGWVSPTASSRRTSTSPTRGGRRGTNCWGSRRLTARDATARWSRPHGRAMLRSWRSRRTAWTRFPSGQARTSRRPTRSFGGQPPVRRRLGAVVAILPREFAERSFVAECPSVDGMSGSPVVDADGTVVGMQHAGGVPETMPAFVDTAVEESDFTFPDRLSRSSAVFERYPPRGYISCVGIEHVVETFERWV